MKMAAARGERPPRRHLKGRLALKALVTVASRHGATSDIGEAIASRLRQHGHEASTAPPDEVAEVGPYDAVILGSAVYMGRWLPAAVDFADRHLVALRDRSVWLFSSGPLGDPPVPAGDAPDVPSLVERVGAREHRTFAGELQEGALGFKAATDRAHGQGALRRLPRLERNRRLGRYDRRSRVPHPCPGVAFDA
jgi:menaquinone-dependent protoporphyrinogen oxidase